jgi:hypothetical protein
MISYTKITCIFRSTPLRFKREPDAAASTVTLHRPRVAVAFAAWWLTAMS